MKQKKMKRDKSWWGIVPMIVGIGFFITCIVVINIFGLDGMMNKPIFFDEVTKWTKVFNLGVWYVIIKVAIDDFFYGLEWIRGKKK